MSLFDDDMLYAKTAEEERREKLHAESVARRLNRALRDMGVTQDTEGDIAKPSELGAFINLRIPVKRADLMVSRMEWMLLEG